MSVAIASWASAEQQCFAYLVDKLQSVADVSCYLGEGPERISADADANYWTFEISGGADITQIAADARPYTCWRMDAVFEAVAVLRETAQVLCGLVLNSVPADEDDIDSVNFFSYAAMPNIRRDTIYHSNDETRGGAVRIWRATLPMRVLFGNSDYSAVT